LQNRFVSKFQQIAIVLVHCGGIVLEAGHVLVVLGYGGSSRGSGIGGHRDFVFDLLHETDDLSLT
jgi:hypothetical protein